ncbi:collagen-like protein [Corynebacterium glucuronolyticum]|uniref:Collagen-like protein n=1 Tax=Corynebacterium glucuronolyticum TaxID=39791 RepID=A0A7T4EF30_9CORY|nr:collagen-like protein [Corynebacterium glucuronolyticum]QQB46193.1 collagen-like protein [Corynebacterium glucuronolyticum]WKD63054.1 Collagen triple helix repeat (20 copies) [Corynebacterium glucuronolyticum DSM 44120]SMB81869.1 hypothetical protein SAMN05660745_02498 [Corynebacterium glucuronolyticum]
MQPLIADGGELTVLRSLAACSYGRWSVTWPESVPEDQRPTLPDDQEFGYVSQLKTTPGRMGRRFVRTDVSITAADYGVDGKPLPYSGASDVETSLDAATKRTSGEVFFEREVTRAGLNGLIPRRDFDVDDLIPVQIWGKVVTAPVTSITDVSEQGAVIDWRVHVGGSLLADSAARQRSNREIEAAIAQERRERLKDVGDANAKAESAYGEAVAARRDGVVARSDAAAAKDAAGRAVTEQVFEFAAGASRVEAPVSGWSQAYPGDEAGVVWQRSVTYFGDGRVERGPAVVTTGAPGQPGPQGPKGEPGADGVPGKNGVGVRDTTITYAASASGTQAPTSGWGIQPPASVPAGQFVWTKTTLRYTDNTTEDIYTVGKIGETGPQGPRGATGAQGPKGATGSDGRPGKDGTKLTSTTVTYAVSTSGTRAPSSGWQVQPPAAAPGQFMWTRFVWTYSDGTSETGYSVGKIGDTGPRGPQGAKGNTGATGPQGPQGPRGATGSRGVSTTSVTHFWRWAGSKPGTPQGTGNPSGWSTSQPAYQVGQKLWVTIRTLFSNGTATWSPVTEEASVSAATAISAEAANTKNRVWYAARDPAARGALPGDTWFRYSGNTIVGQWRWTGTSWVTQTIGNQVIANLDAGKITSGIIDARRIGAETIDASKIKADSITVRELRAGTIVPIGTSLIVSEPPRSWAAPEPIWWQQPGLGTVVDGATGKYAAPLGNRYKYSQGGTTAPPMRLVKVQPGKKYRLRFWTWAFDAGSRLYIEMRDKNGAYAVKSGAVSSYVTPKKKTGNWGGWAGPRWDYTGSARGSYLVENLEVPTTPTLIESTIAFNPEVEWVKLAKFYWSHPNGVKTVQYLAGLTLDLDVIDQAQIDANQSAQIAINKKNIELQAAVSEFLRLQRSFDHATNIYRDNLIDATRTRLINASPSSGDWTKVITNAGLKLEYEGNNFNQIRIRSKTFIGTAVAVGTFTGGTPFISVCNFAPGDLDHLYIVEPRGKTLYELALILSPRFSLEEPSNLISLRQQLLSSQNKIRAVSDELTALVARKP